MSINTLFVLTHAATLILSLACDQPADAPAPTPPAATASAPTTEPPDPGPARVRPGEVERQLAGGEGSAEGPAALALGATAPMRDTSMMGTDGEQHTIESVAGQHGTLVVFTCVHCPWARRWESRLVELGNTYGGRGIGVIAVNPNDPEEYPVDGMEGMQERARATGMRFPFVVDATSDVARAYGATKTPEAFLFDPEWRLVYHGAVDDNANEPDQVQSHYLRDALSARIAGNAPDPAQTRAIGCSIKFRPQS